MAGTLVANTINTDTGLFATNNAYLGIAKAWVNFNGSTAAIRSSFNVSSITKNGTGDYTVNFTTAMPDANYVTNITMQRGDSAGNNPGNLVPLPFVRPAERRQDTAVYLFHKHSAGHYHRRIDGNFPFQGQEQPGLYLHADAGSPAGAVSRF